MENNRWEQRYQDGETGWDTGVPAPALSRWIKTAASFTHGIAAGVGRGYDLWELAKVCETVTGLEIAPSAIADFEAKNPPPNVQLKLVDFFAYDGTADLAWDYTFLCAIDPSERNRWAEKYAEIITGGGKLVTLLFPVADDWPEGPPHRIDPDEIQTLLAGHFRLDKIAPASASHPGRENLEFWAEFTRK